ncbi:hypothetical protein KFK09_001464 [Dendrobium nobile]|uniref:Uncharacterized protein n=1 Tax=Dendrobium nobile TaxID=94219 RepID=A0A8T3C519_DENNO|nr:hypothetical protein KFK09_001464 [Dendrobium nobile]
MVSEPLSQRLSFLSEMGDSTPASTASTTLAVTHENQISTDVLIPPPSNFCSLTSRMLSMSNSFRTTTQLGVRPFKKLFAANSLFGYLDGSQPCLPNSCSLPPVSLL